MTPSTHPIFWRSPDLPYVELRHVVDGREVSYAPHSHKEWSIGAILDGQSEFLCEGRLHQVEKGILVLMNPDAVHACHPCKDSPWSYYMMHLDKHWLASLLKSAGVRPELDWRDSRLDTLLASHFYQDFVSLCRSLMSSQLTSIEKDASLKKYFVRLFEYLDHVVEAEKTLLPPNRLYQVADYLNQHCLEDRSIDLISDEFGFSTGYLVRAFKRHFNMTPHAYRLNRRVQLGQQALKAGQAISEVAQAVGFSDQAHFQRVFKQRVAATPNQYRRSMFTDQKAPLGKV
ncbi:AraC family transcriptional regulator [Marinomonas transparens]|uniref:AraC family transcriptional regulator n=1 Tax=Marinomonas transparens TaxID=2795388 RepID=A0A934JT83_9GAMM|nr:AraC family transcriptional regulator [Marinomonas transparens]MBJ7537891.1 AraC family transcriptional regulator [Marinomonas transparens]